jgi:ribose transport system substrate-binding protein
LVGIWSYNGPAILNAVRERGRLGELGIVCFDEEAETLQGIADGHIAATIVQQPYEFGRRSVGVLAQLIAGDQSSLPADRKLHVPTQVVNGENVEDFRNRLQSLLKDS